MQRSISILLLFCVLCPSIGRLTNQTSQKTITLELKSFHDGQMFYTPMTVGKDNNEKTFRMLVATSHYLTWIVSTNFSAECGYDYRSSDGYNPGRYISRTIYGSFNYYIHNDTWRMNSHLPPLNSQPFALVYNTPGNNDWMIEEVDGRLGLDDWTGRSDSVDYLFKNLLKSKYIHHIMYSLYINNTAIANRLVNNDSLQPDGALVLGGKDDKYYTGELKYAKMHHGRQLNPNYADLYDEDKSLYISNINLDWSRASEDKLDDSISRLGTFDIDMQPTRLILDSSLILHYGPRGMLNTIHMGIMGADSIIADDFYAFKDCRLDNKPDIIFTIMDGFNVSMTPEEYVIEEDIDSLKVCLSAFKPNRHVIWVFGTQFMRNYYTVFDYENDQVGLATPA